MRILLCFLLFIGSSSFIKVDIKSFELDENPLEIQKTALLILESKCNDCHQVERKQVYTLSNMNSHDAAIYKQVFVKRKMPKGDDNNLSEGEEQSLKLWLTNVQSSQDQSE